MFDVTLLGTGGMIPLKNRWLTGLWVEKDGSAVLIDCGEGMQIAIAEKELKLSHLDLILITHVHADHIAGLPGLLLSLGNSGKTGKLRIAGPERTAETVAALRTLCPVLPYDLEVTEIRGVGSLGHNGMTIDFLPLSHDLPCMAYSLTQDKGFCFDPDKARELGIDVRYWKQLHGGETVTSDGRTFTPDMVSKGDKGRIKVTYITDTRYFGGLADFARDSDLLIAEAMYPDDEHLGKMNEKGHMVLSQSISIARESGSKELWLTHFSPAFTDISDFEEQARSMFANISMNEKGSRKVIK